MKIEVFDRPMCCPTGVCGPAVDPELVRFASDVAWLERQGVAVERHNLSQDPAAFASSAVVREALERDGNDCLPLLVVDGAVRSKGKYPTRQALAELAGLPLRPTLYTDAVRELVAIGAAIASNCEPCFKHHYNEARKLGVSKEDLRLAVETARMVKDTPARSILALADKYLAASPLQVASCRGGDDGAAGGKCC